MKSSLKYRQKLVLVSTFLTAALLITLGQVFSVPSLKSAGLHFIFPGLGLLNGFEDLGLGALCAGIGVMAFLAALFFWLAMGNWALLLIVWFAVLGLSVNFSGAIMDENLSPFLAMALAGAALGWPLKRAEAACIEAGYSRFETANFQHCTTEQVNFLRLRAQQNKEAFEGFNQIEQYQTSALRYQITFMGYALALVSAFKGEAEKDTQQKLIEKQFQPQVWEYWQRENLWGNFQKNANPLTQQNIMYSGFLALQIELFHKSAKAAHFDQQGSIVLEGARKRFCSSQPELVEGLAQQYRNSRFGLLCCEPNWIYPICNIITACALQSFDRRHGTDYWAPIAPRFFERLESDFVMKNGSFLTARSERLGIAVPPLASTTTEAFACMFLNAIDIRSAHEHWALTREKILARPLYRSLTPLDIGNYRPGFASSLAVLAAAAAEMGDDEVLVQMLEALEQRHPKEQLQDVEFRPGVSIWAHSLEMMARTNPGDGFRQLILKRG